MRRTTLTAIAAALCAQAVPFRSFAAPAPDSGARGGSNGAQASFDRTMLSITPPPFAGKIGKAAQDSAPAFRPRVKAPAGAPNVLLVMMDDVGFTAPSTFGGPIPTPNFTRLAQRGLTYNKFHVTAICSATRAALLTGRNHHAVGSGTVNNLATGYPGYDSFIPKSAATIARVLRDNGYSTAMFGKNHNTPNIDISAAGPFDRWPTGLGFDYFYGFMSDEADQYTPGIYRGTSLVPPSKDIMDKALADDAINWLHDQDAAASGRPFFMYYATGSTHMPHQAPADWIERFRGKFDAGWDALRAESARRVLDMGLVPAGTVDVPRPNGIPPWDSLTPEQKRVASRMMEVYAGMLAYADAQIGRVIDEIDRMGKGDDTLIMYVEGDNGAQASPFVKGSLNVVSRHVNGYKETDADLAAMIDKLGGPETFGDYGGGWAWATSAPFPLFKTFASHLGGTRNGLVVSWPERIKARGIRSQFTHVNDVMPTILDAAGIPQPVSVDGVKQQPINGTSFTYSFDDAKAPERHRTQYFETSGNQGIYHDGWWANTTPVNRTFDSETGLTARTVATPMTWELYNLNDDFSQSHDLAAKEPAKLAEMRALFDKEARANNVYPIDSVTSLARFLAQDVMLEKRNKYVYWSSGITVPRYSSPPILSNSFTITAAVDIPKAGATGTILALGGKFGGWSFYLRDGKPGAIMAASYAKRDRFVVDSSASVPAGKSTISYSFDRKPGYLAGGMMSISIDGKRVAEGPIERTIGLLPDPTSGLSIGFDSDTPVTDFLPGDGRLPGAIDKVEVDIR
jgi:arylsulfatase